jgi:hypothetical protein
MCSHPEFEFECSPADGHGHPHLLGFARYQLLDLEGNVLAEGGKRSFCMLDTACSGGVEPSFEHCLDQGISASCHDDYPPSLGCQYVDATAVPGATTRALRLRAEVDPDGVLPDADRTNNVAEVTVGGCGDGQLQGGEECDGGPCCDPDCRLRLAGTSCRAAATPCDLRETCDGVSAACPTDRRAANGTTCGPGAPPCTRQVCRAGSCLVERVAPGCLIDGACHLPGATDPGDACRRCDVSQPDTWSPVAGADLAGLRCQMARVFADTALACPARPMRAARARLTRTRRIIERLNVVAPERAAFLHGRAVRIVTRASHNLDRASARCETADLEAEVNGLLDQLRRFAL